MNNTPRQKLTYKFLTSFFKILYTDLAWAYDTVAWISSVGQWRTWQRTGLQSLAAGNTLEIGFGTGHLLEELASANVHVVGVDISSQMAEITMKRIRRASITAPIAQASAFNLPFPDSAFTSVLSTFPSEYIFAPETFAEIYRVLKPGGQMVVVPGVIEITGPRTRRFSILRYLDKLSSWLYAFTGEQINVSADRQGKLEQELKQMGFSARIEPVVTDRAVVLRMVAVKD